MAATKYRTHAGPHGWNAPGRRLHRRQRGCRAFQLLRHAGHFGRVHDPAPDGIVGQLGSDGRRRGQVLVSHVSFGVYFFPLLGRCCPTRCWASTARSFSCRWSIARGTRRWPWTRRGSGWRIGLTLIAIGSGGIKPCVSANVGDQFGSRNKASAREGVLLVLLFDQFRRVLLDAADALAAGPLRAELGVRRAGHVHGTGDDRVLDGPAQVRPRAAGRARVSARGIQPRRTGRARQSSS